VEDDDLSQGRLYLYLPRYEAAQVQTANRTSRKAAKLNVGQSSAIGQVDPVARQQIQMTDWDGAART
jgi:hypothetical protein